MKIMKTTLAKLAALLLLSTLNSQLSTVSAQGSLTPPGAPATTMRTLDQIEPRTPISSLPFTISTPGIYYLTKNITTAGNGIVINANDVVLDLGGFTIVGDRGVADTGVDITTQTNVTIRNGTVRNFGTGVNVGAASSKALVEDLLLTENNGNGLEVSYTTTISIFRRVRAIGNVGDGIEFFFSNFAQVAQNIFDQCEAANNGSDGIRVGSSGNLIIRCVASGNGGNNYAINANNRFGIIVVPAVSSAFGSSGGAGTGTTDPFANLSF